jgi:hypothetical protein
MYSSFSCAFGLFGFHHTDTAQKSQGEIVGAAL